ncbi:hypothetical protein ACHAXA_010463 [Cyclostephanos tholiformis]|uniref:Phosphatidic acid phosphatase type 2/haloperoxidase domain-containing protein n=1 Tax=Cyclostephanos tholiformis TaxID=382380 RepID=A0ABD3SFQ2_9STRA
MVVVLAALCPSLILSLLTGADALTLASHHRRSSRVIPDGVMGRNPRTVAAALASPSSSPRPVDESSSSSSSSSSYMTSSESDGKISRSITTWIGKTASTLVSFSFFLLLAYRRDAVVLSIWIGSILNAIFGKVVKRLLNHDRPAELIHNDDVRLKPSDGGMPSSHAMSLAFIGTSIALGIVPVGYRAGVGLVVSTYSAIALRYRVRDHLHTVPQVVVGLVLGTMNALAWLEFGVGGDGGGGGNANVGPILSYVRRHWISSETGLFSYTTLAVPVVVGIIVVGSFERRISAWMEEKKKEG